MRPRQFTDEQLLETAREVILKHGPGVPAATIAKALGVSSAALFKRVGTKSELVRRALLGGDDPAADYIARLEAGPSAEPVPGQLLDVVRDIDRFFERLMPALAMLKSSGFCPGGVFEGEENPPPVRAVQGLARWFTLLNETGRARISNPVGIAVALFGSLQARHMMRAVIGDRYPDGGPDYLETIVHTIWAGIAPKPAPPTE